MRTPEQALSAARERAAAAQARGEYRDVQPSLDLSPSTRVSRRRLAAWAIIDPARPEVYSTRRFGQPITALKRLLIRFLRQYIDQLSAQQSRFNAQAAAHLLSLDERMRALEERSGQPDPGVPSERR